MFNSVSRNAKHYCKTLWSMKHSHGPLISGKLFGAIGKPKILRETTKVIHKHTYNFYNLKLSHYVTV